MSPNGKGGEYVTRYEVENMVRGIFKEYEREIVQPRHNETQGALAEIKEIVQKGKGAAWLAGILAGLASVCWIVLQIRGALMHP